MNSNQFAETTALFQLNERCAQRLNSEAEEQDSDAKAQGLRDVGTEQYAFSFDVWAVGKDVADLWRDHGGES